MPKNEKDVPWAFSVREIAAKTTCPVMRLTRSWQLTAGNFGAEDNFRRAGGRPSMRQEEFGCSIPARSARAVLFIPASFESTITNRSNLVPYSYLLTEVLFRATLGRDPQPSPPASSLLPPRSFPASPLFASSNPFLCLPRALPERRKCALLRINSFVCHSYAFHGGRGESRSWPCQR
jgi:hypothetical protein